MRLPVLLRKRKLDTSKRDYGYVLVIGGSVGLTGAVCLCAQAVLRVGAGLVRVAVPQSILPIVMGKLTEEMSAPLKEDGSGHLSLQAFPQIPKMLDIVDVVAIGPGASTYKGTCQLMRKLVEKVDKPLVVDADGINALSENLAVLERRRHKSLILTPHYGEFARLIKEEVDVVKKHRKELAKKFALRYNLVLALKGHHTLVTDGHKLFENNTGNPGMAKAGSGDVLTGIIAGLLAQGVATFEAAKLGVYLHGLAGDIAVWDKTELCLVASDIISYLPRAVKIMIKK